MTTILKATTSQTRLSSKIICWEYFFFISLNTVYLFQLENFRPKRETVSDLKDSFALLANLLKMKRAYVVLFLSYMEVFLDQISPLACETMRWERDKWCWLVQKWHLYMVSLQPWDDTNLNSCWPSLHRHDLNLYLHYWLVFAANLPYLARVLYNNRQHSVAQGHEMFAALWSVPACANMRQCQCQCGEQTSCQEVKEVRSESKRVLLKMTSPNSGAVSMPALAPLSVSAYH